MIIELKRDAPSHRGTRSPLCRAGRLVFTPWIAKSLLSHAETPRKWDRHRKGRAGWEASPLAPKSNHMSKRKAVERVEIVFPMCCSGGNRALPLGEAEKQAPTRGFCYRTCAVGPCLYRCHMQLCPAPASSLGATGQHIGRKQGAKAKVTARGKSSREKAQVIFQVQKWQSSAGCSAVPSPSSPTASAFEQPDDWLRESPLCNPLKYDISILPPFLFQSKKWFSWPNMFIS